MYILWKLIKYTISITTHQKYSSSPEKGIPYLKIRCFFGRYSEYSNVPMILFLPRVPKKILFYLAWQPLIYEGMLTQWICYYHSKSWNHLINASIPRFPIHSHSLAQRNNNSYFVYIKSQPENEIFGVCVVCKNSYLGLNGGWLL